MRCCPFLIQTILIIQTMTFLPLLILFFFSVQLRFLVLQYFSTIVWNKINIEKQTNFIPFFLVQQEREAHFNHCIKFGRMNIEKCSFRAFITSCKI